MAEVKCPANELHLQEETVSKLKAENRYRCTCSCVFEWKDVNDWRILRPPIRLFGSIDASKRKDWIKNVMRKV